MVLDFSNKDKMRELLQRVERLEVELEELKTFYNNHINRLHKSTDKTGGKNEK